LPFRQCVQLGERVLNSLFMLFRRRRILGGLVLIFGCVQLEIEKTGEIATCIPTAEAAAPALTKRHLNLTEGSFGPKQSLQGLLLERNSIFPVHALELVCCRN